ncbi:MAG: hypothetical protein KGZ80_05840 [Methylomonas sp.]|nr:hypothetical protein [Methylomonas sp.]PPD39745.1 MAG: hypothetical protein CTY21_00800 [Methylomonas sp.]
MKAIKKHIKSRLSAVEEAASELALLSVEVPLLYDVQAMATSVLQACSELRISVRAADKADLPGRLLGMNCLGTLEAALDRDDASTIEQRFFDLLPDQSEGDLAGFLQAWVLKIEKACAKLAQAIRWLMALIEVDTSGCDV